MVRNSLNGSRARTLGTFGTAAFHAGRTLVLTKLDRTSIVKHPEDVREVTYGRRADGVCPSKDLLDQLELDQLSGFQGGLSIFDVLMDLIDAIAAGEQIPASRYNYLDDGMWELKPKGKLRATFYDTDGLGHYTPKRGDRRWSTGEGKERNFYVETEKDTCIRLGHWFVKSGRTTAQSDLDASFDLRDEDLTYDIVETSTGPSELTRGDS